MSLRNEQCNKVCRILDDVLANRPTERDSLITAVRKAFGALETESHWIPCSEKLPENDESVLATTAWGDVTIAERVYPPINYTCWFIHDGNTNATIDDVVAWMPLPEPWKGDGND